MKTPIQKAIELVDSEIQELDADRQPNHMIILKRQREVLQSLLPYEMECFVETHENAVSNYCDYQSVPGTELVSAHDYFTQTFKQ